MSIKKNVASVDGKASNAPSTPEKQFSPSAEVKLDRKLLESLISDEATYDAHKVLADTGGMAWCGIKDAKHLESVVNAQGKKVILRSKVASVKQALSDLDKQGIKDALNAQFQDDDRKAVSGRVSFFFNEEEGDWGFRSVVKHSDLRKNGGGNGKLKNGNDLPNAKPASKKPLPTLEPKKQGYPTMTLAQLCFSFKGRVNRSVYWVFTLIGVFMPTIMLAGGGILSELGVSEIVLTIIAIAYIAMTILLIIANIAIIVKRLHDTNRSGVYILIALIPIIGALYLLIVCGFLKGTYGENSYGAPLKGF